MEKQYKSSKHPLINEESGMAQTNRSDYNRGAKERAADYAVGRSYEVMSKSKATRLREARRNLEDLKIAREIEQGCDIG